MIEAARRQTQRHFGKTIQLYAPLYLSNECVNGCAYCGFNSKSHIRRITLTIDQIAKEAGYLRKQGFQHVLMLTGESKEIVPVDYLREAVKCLKKIFVSVSIEVYPLSEAEYRSLVQAGTDGLTIYQETYHLPTYHKVHPFGPKRNYRFRLGSAERAAAAGMRKIGLGVLLGLYDWRYESEKLAQHLRYLLKKYWQTQFQLSFPRINPAETNFKVEHPVSDNELILMICSFRLAFPQIPFALSTREKAELRDQIFPLGITSMSAGSRTCPGGYSLGIKSGKQFEIADTRSVKEVCRSLVAAGYEPVFKDWERSFS
ncbi:MAG: 2-iminoacetate synthase ThiH [Candidatus Margulisiibacteriota bacterium]